METQKAIEGSLRCCQKQKEEIIGGKKPQRSGRTLNIMFVRPGQRGYHKQAKKTVNDAGELEL